MGARDESSELCDGRRMLGMERRPRLVDLHTDWLLQYVPEMTLFDPAIYPRVAQRLNQAEGYLGTTWAAVLACYRSAAEWERRADPWAALIELVARIEAEFCGRVLMSPIDYQRWQDDTSGLAWGVIGVEGFDSTVRLSADLTRLHELFRRGARLFQPLYGGSNLLGGSAIVGDERGLTDLGLAFLATLQDIAADSAGPRPILDLAHMNPRTAGDVLSWFEADEDRIHAVIPVYSHGALWHERCPSPRAISRENLRRLRALGGVVGFGVSPPFYDTPETLKSSIEEAAALPFRGSAGYEGIAIGTDFLGVDQTAPGLRNAAEVVSWVSANFDAESAHALIQGNGQSLFARSVGVSQD
jgi:membrane dipeptidase